MQKTIYLSGGSFYALQDYFSRVKGVTAVTAGYINGTSAFPKYENVINGGADHKQAIKIDFEENLISLKEILGLYLKIIDPNCSNGQGEYKGPCYRLGIYYIDVIDGITIVHYVDSHLGSGHHIDIGRFENFFPAEPKHQNYAKTHPFWHNPLLDK
jgi:methionine-S-sulfoxide reductase